MNNKRLHEHIQDFIHIFPSHRCRSFFFTFFLDLMKCCPLLQFHFIAKIERMHHKWTMTIINGMHFHCETSNALKWISANNTPFNVRDHFNSKTILYCLSSSLHTIYLPTIANSFDVVFQLALIIEIQCSYLLEHLNYMLLPMLGHVLNDSWDGSTWSFGFRWTSIYIVIIHKRNVIIMDAELPSECAHFIEFDMKLSP